MKRKTTVPISLFDSLQALLKLTQESPQIPLADIFKMMRGRGQATLLIFFSIPFCFPIQIPGLSTPFGLILAFLGLSFFMGWKPWLPRWIKEKSFSSSKVAKCTKVVIKIIKAMEKVLHARWIFLVSDPILHRIHGILIFICALLLSLPLPVPFTNMVVAFPLLTMGLGLLKDDGLFIVISYLMTFVAGFFFWSLIDLGLNHFHRFF